MNAHTPGPWVLTPTGAFVYSESHPTDYFWMDVRLAHPKLADQDPSFLANGRLIAAAPEMLDELQYVHNSLRLLKYSVRSSTKLDPRWDGMDAKLDEYIFRIETVVAKATQP